MGDLGKCFARSLGHLTVVAVGLASVLLHGTATETDIAPPKPQAQGSAQHLIDAHDCWVGSPPADMVGQIPGHVVIRFNGGDVKLGGTRAVGLALEHLFAKPDPRVAQVHAFCR